MTFRVTTLDIKPNNEKLIIFTVFLDHFKMYRQFFLFVLFCFSMFVLLKTYDTSNLD